jgi:ankyrin repeat protein
MSWTIVFDVSNHCAYRCSPGSPVTRSRGLEHNAVMVDVLREHDEFGRSAIHYAAANGDAAEVARLLAQGADPGEPDAAEFTPLHFAAQEQHPDVVKMLLKAGADVRARDRWGNTPLWRAVFTAHGDASTSSTLLAAGADPDAANNTGISPRRLAHRMGLVGLTGPVPPQASR